MQGNDDRSVSELVTELSQETVTLVRQEIQLAEAEMTRKAIRVGKNAGLLAAGGVVAYTGSLTLVAATVALLGERIPVWRSAAVVGVGISAVGLGLAVKGANTLRQEDPVPRESVETLKEDREWLKDQTS